MGQQKPKPSTTTSTAKALQYKDIDLNIILKIFFTAHYCLQKILKQNIKAQEFCLMHAKTKLVHVAELFSLQYELSFLEIVL
jgi:hypothetical protein